MSGGECREKSVNMSQECFSRKVGNVVKSWHIVGELVGVFRLIRHVRLNGTDIKEIK